MTEVRALNRDAAKHQSESVFESPLDIVNEILLTKGEKLATLNRWRRRILGELDASNEGMATRGYASEQLTALEGIFAPRPDQCLDVYLVAANVCRWQILLQKSAIGRAL
jgi:hypothetical protein